MFSRAIVYILGIFFILSGANHFLNPAFYHPLIPDYLPFPSFVNLASGASEIAFGLGLFFLNYRKKSAMGIFILLVLFIPSHVFFIQIGSCIPDGLCVPTWIGWLRLLVIHPLLLFWAFAVSQIKS